MPVGDIPIWEWCWMALAIISALMHILVMVTILRAHRSKFNNILKAPFFTIIFIESIHEILELCTTTGFNRLRKYRIIEYELKEDNELVEWQWYWYCFMKSVLYLGHLEIALNRLSAVILTRYKMFDELWSTKNIIYMNLIGYLILAGGRVIIYNIFYPDVVVTTFIVKGSGFFGISSNPETASAFESMVDIILSLGTGIICILCYSTTAILQRKHGYLNLKTKKQEATLLKIGIVTFLILLPTTIRSAIELYANLTDQEALQSFVSIWNMIPAEAMCIVQPWLLLIFCRSLRETMFSRQSTKISTAVTASSSQPN